MNPNNKAINLVQSNFKTIETILFIAVLAALFMKILHVPFSGMLLVLTLGTLSTCYFFLANAAPQEGENVKMVLFTNRILYLGCSIATIGFLFVIQSWPSARMFLFVGSGLVLIAGVVCIKMQLKMNMVRWLTILVVAAFFLFTSKETLIKLNINRAHVQSVQE